MKNLSTAGVEPDILAEYINSERYERFKRDRSELEDKWERNREAYLCIPDNKWKPKDKIESWESQTFIGKTHQKVIAAYSIVIDLLLKNETVPFDVKITDRQRELIQMLPAEQGVAILEQVRIATEGMKATIKSQLEIGHSAETLMKCVLSAALYGESYSKRRIEYVVTEKGWRPVQIAEGVTDTSMMNGGSSIPWEQYINKDDMWVFGYVPVWDIFRDLNDKDGFGDGIIHRIVSNSYKLRRMKGNPFFIDNRIDEILDSGNYETPSDTTTLAPYLRNLGSTKSRRYLYEFWGPVPRVIVEQFEKSLGDESEDLSYMPIDADEQEENGDEVLVMAVICNGVTIRYARVREEDIPFNRAVWEDMPDELAPKSVADNIENEQSVINGVMQQIENNAKLSANVMSATKEEYFRTAIDKLFPGAKFPLSESCDDARKAIQPIIIPNVSGPLIEILRLMEEFTDQDSMIPKVSQGLQAKSDTTATEVLAQTDGAGKYIGGIIRNVDNGLIKPWVQHLYDENMHDPNVPFKGNFEVFPTGFTSYQSRRIAIAGVTQLLQIMVAVPAFAEQLSVRRISGIIANMLDQDVDTVLLTLQELQAKHEAQMQDPMYQAGLAEVGAKIERNKAEAEKERAMSEKAKAEAAAIKIESKLEVKKAISENKQANI